MRTIFTFLNHLRGSMGDLQSSDVSHDCRLTVGSPSGLDAKWKQNPFMRFAVVLTLIFTIGSGNVWGASTTGTIVFSSATEGNGKMKLDATPDTGKDTQGNTWNFSTTSSYFGSNSSYYQVGSNSNVAGTIEFSMTLASDVSFTAFSAKFQGASNKSNQTASLKIDGTAVASATISGSSTITPSYTTATTGKTLTVTLTGTAGGVKCYNISYTYEPVASCSNSVAVTKGSESHGEVTTIGSASVATCSSTESDRRVTITITPDDCYDAPSSLTWTKSSGTVTASKQSGPMDNGDGTYSYVYQFAQNDNGAGTFGVTCTAKAAGKTVNFDAGPGVSASSSLTETCDGSGVTLPSVTASGVCKGWTTFAGWATAAVSDSTTTSGVTLYAAGDNFVPASNGQTLYAVYSKSKGGGGFKLSLVASGTTYYVGQKGSGNYLSAETSSANAAIFTYENGYLYYDDSGTKKYISITGNNTNLYVTTDKPEVTWTESGTTTFSYLTSAATRYLAYNGSTNPVRFASYNNNSSYPQYFTKHSTATTYYCSDPNCCTPLGTINGSINLSSSTDGTVTISGWTYDAGSTGTTESNVSSYTVKLYKYNNGTSSWALANESSTTGGASGPAATRTGIAVSGEGSKSVTYSGLEYGATYKFTVTANGTGSYCDGDETAVTSINGNALTDNKFLNKYSIYIDEHDNSSYTHHYIESLSSHSGSVDINLEAFKNGTAAGTYYQYKLVLGGVLWFGNNGTMNSTYHDNWTFSSGESSNCKLQTAMGGAYTFAINTTDGGSYPQVSVNFPSANQAAGYNIYWDNSVLNWGTLRYRIGNNSNNQNQTPTLVPGTDNFYVVTTPLYNDMEAWHFANNPGWADSHTIYRTATDGNQTGIAITASTVFQQYKVTEDITVIPTTTHSTGTDNDGDKVNNQCEFYTINTPTSGMLTHNIAVGSADHGTVVATYTNTSGTAGQTVAEGANADLAHRCIVTITATPDAGYSCTSLTVNEAAFTSGNTHILTADATVAATFTAQTSTVTLDNNDATSGSQQTVSATYDAAMPLTTTSSTPVAALSRTGYTFTGWWDATSGGTQYYSYNAGTSTLSSARTWDKTGAQTLKAQWSINSYTLTWNLGGRGKITIAGTAAPENATGTPHDDIAYNTAITVPVAGNANGYTFTGWSPEPASNMPAENTTYTAQWSANVYTVTLNNHDATTAGATSVSATFGQAMPSIADNLPEKTGYRFDGYYTAASGGTKYYNADGSSAATMAMYGATPTLHAHWVAQLTFTVNGVADGTLTRDDNTAMPSTAAVPTACGDCWAFMGWSTNSSESGAPAYAGGATHEFGEPTTLYAVFGKAEYQMITSTSELKANDYYVVASSTEWALSNADHSYYNTSNYYTHTDAASTDISSISKSNANGYYIYNPSASIIWKFSGTKDAGQLQNVATPAKYVNLTATNLLATAQDLKFSVSSDGETWIIQYSTTNFLHGYTDSKGNGFETLSSSNWEEGDYSAFLYRQISAEYATEPSCESYNIVWKVDDTTTSDGSPTEETNTCAGIETLPTNPDDDDLDCATKFMGWSESKLIGTGHSAPADLFTTVGNAPTIDEDKTFHAVFASVDTENTTTVTDNLTCTLTGITGTTYTEWSGKSDNSSAVYAGNSCESSTNKAIQIRSKNSNSGIVTTASGGKAKKITITWSDENASGRTIDIYGKNSAYSDATDLYSEIASTLGTKLGSIVYGTSTEFTITGDYAYIGIRSSDGAAYLSNVAIKWESAAYKDYLTSCCDELVTLSTNSPANGTISFSPASPIATCDANKTVTMTITPSAGYKLSDWAVATGDGKVPASSTVPAVVTGEDNSDAQVITLTFNQHLSGDYAVSATFEQMHDEYYDYMHDNAKVGANRTGAYSAPSRTSKTPTSGEYCKTDHYKFKGWVVSTEINDDGTLKDGYTLITAGSSMTASNKVYYAVWAEEE